jgi:crotonobetainyl-CoA:carnitine CoA-transferase CaiB-like acyl-CoA transferase
LLGDQGADVIKVESPQGDHTRAAANRRAGFSASFLNNNRSKRSIVLDLKTDEGAAILHKLVTTADVFVQNFRTGVIDRMGFGEAAIRALSPDIIYVSISGFGETGPYRDRRAYDLLIQAEGGSCAITGRPGEPVKPGIPIADIGTALYAYSSVLAALYQREHTGRGAVIPIAMLDVVGEMMGFAINQVLHAGIAPEPVGMGSPAVAPYGAYPTADGQTAVLGTTSDREWRRLTRDLLGRPELAQDPRYARNTDRVRHRAELDGLMRDWCAQYGLAEIQRRADEAGIGNARLNGVRELAEHPQLAARGRWQQVGSPVGPLPALLPPGLARDWTAGSGRVPALGQDTAAIRAEVGLDT